MITPVSNYMKHGKKDQSIPDFSGKMEEELIFGILILASITVFIVSLYIVVPTLMFDDKIDIEEERRKELDKFLMSRGVLKDNDKVPTEA